jgi:hypothetical protein
MDRSGQSPVGDRGVNDAGTNLSAQGGLRASSQRYNNNTSAITETSTPTVGSTRRHRASAAATVDSTPMAVDRSAVVHLVEVAELGTDDDRISKLYSENTEVRIGQARLLVRYCPLPVSRALSVCNWTAFSFLSGSTLCVKPIGTM